MKSRIWVFACFLSLTASMYGAASNLSPDLAGLPPAQIVNVIIQYTVTPNQAKLITLLGLGGVLNDQLGVINSVSATLPMAAVTLIARDSQVVYISLNRPVKMSLDYAEPAINALTAFQNGYDGTGVGIAIIDSGVGTHPDLYNSKAASRVVYNQDFTTKKQPAAYNDSYGHGEHVAGILAGDASQSVGAQFTHTFRGIAPNANLINLRALDKNGAGTDASVILAIQQAIALKAQYNIRVINLSLGRGVIESYTRDPLCRAVERAWQAGIVVVVAAGNGGRDNTHNTNGYGTINSPGNDPLVITVGAMNDKRTQIGRAHV